MSKTKKEKKVRAVPIGIVILVFVVAFIGGVVSKFAITPSWSKITALSGVMSLER